MRRRAVVRTAGALLAAQCWGTYSKLGAMRRVLWAGAEANRRRTRRADLVCSEALMGDPCWSSGRQGSCAGALFVTARPRAEGGVNATARRPTFRLETPAGFQSKRGSLELLSTNPCAGVRGRDHHGALGTGLHARVRPRRGGIVSPPSRARYVKENDAQRLLSSGCRRWLRPSGASVTSPRTPGPASPMPRRAP